MTRAEAIAGYWSAETHAEAHKAWQWLIRHGVVEGDLCAECAEQFQDATREVSLNAAGRHFEVSNIGSGVSGHRATHWMPLPEPQK